MLIVRFNASRQLHLLIIQPAMSTFVSTATKTALVATAACAVLATNNHTVHAHGYIAQPKAQYANSYTKTSFNTVINEKINHAFQGRKWDGSPEQNTQQFTEAFATAGYSSLRQMLDGVAGCGNSRVDIAPVSVAGMSTMHFQNDEHGEGFSASHHGPCEVWIDGNRAFHGDDCRAQFPGYPASIPVDYSVCSGKCTLTFYWLALHEPQWQVYKQCVPITTSRRLPAMSTFVSTATKTALVATAACAVLATNNHTVHAHGYIAQPKAQYANSYTKTSFNTVINEKINHAFQGRKWDGSPEQNTQQFTEAFATAGYSSLRQMLDGVAGCGNSRVDIAPVSVAGMSTMHFQNDEHGEGFSASHHGPCEVWIDGHRAFHGDDCRAQFPGYPASIPVDYSVCSGKCTLTFYWLALHEPQWQVYKQCVPITTSRRLVRFEN
ncbi:TPA: hypothetical protein N0F65_000703 [Lagenidium giganteum]|uniref:Uncharacterized protein n=1 Tax=Lagenidium giganteum TaxID=4803 RepID=A0AAV2Z0X7_9STRA|nr:TPA: hypothetical protein N0F65_000703 [Lagenidium giganteum]